MTAATAIAVMTSTLATLIPQMTLRRRVLHDALTNAHFARACSGSDGVGQSIALSCRWENFPENFEHNRLVS